MSRTDYLHWYTHTHTHTPTYNRWLCVSWCLKESVFEEAVLLIMLYLAHRLLNHSRVDCCMGDDCKDLRAKNWLGDKVAQEKSQAEGSKSEATTVSHKLFHWLIEKNGKYRWGYISWMFIILANFSFTKWNLLFCAALTLEWKLLFVRQYQWRECWHSNALFVYSLVKKYFLKRLHHYRHKSSPAPPSSKTGFRPSCARFRKSNLRCAAWGSDGF